MHSPENDELIRKIIEWCESRERIFAADFSKIPFAEHKQYWDRLAKAEHALMDEARKLKAG
jgi:hypothetical protein